MDALGDARQMLLRTGLALAVTVAAWLLVGMVAGAADAQTSDAEPPPTMVILARSDNPADALSSGPVGGMLGAPVLLTPSAFLHTAAGAALQTIDPDLVVLAGGTAALSTEVEAEVNALGYPTRRAAGADRHETAALVSALLAEFSTGRPVLTGVPVTDQVIPGLNAERLQGHTPDELLADLTAQVDALQTQVNELTALLNGVTRDAIDGRDTLRFVGMNLQVVNGTDTTGGDPNGLGNIIIGYNAQRPDLFGGPVERTGSHYLVVGDEHAWTRFGGIVAGRANTATGQWATVTGGQFNTASGNLASVSGGSNNTASGLVASVTGGFVNTASGNLASVTGGEDNTANGPVASVTGGSNNTASGSRAAVSGGAGNVASGSRASVTGGQDNTASGDRASVSGGRRNDAAGLRTSILGGQDRTVTTPHGCHPAC